MSRSLAIITALVVVPTFASAQDKGEFTKLDDQLVAAILQGDGTTAASFYKDDATIMPPGSEMLKGKSDIASFWNKAPESTAELKITIVDFEFLGNSAAREIGTGKIKTKGQTPQEVSAKYVHVWQKVENDWKITTDTWNTNK